MIHSPPTSSPRILLCFFFCSSFFSLFLFLFSSSPACYAPYFSSTGTQPDKYCFTFSAILFECTLRVGLHRTLAARSADPSRTFKYFACAATPRVPPAFDREWFHHLANGSQLHAFSQGRAFLCFVVHAHSIGDRRLQVAGAKKKNRWHCTCFQEATSSPCFAMICNGRVHRLLGTRRKVKIFQRKRSLHRTVLSPMREFAPSSRRRATNQCFLSLLVESYGGIVKDSSCVHWKSEEHNSDRWLAFQSKKR